MCSKYCPRTPGGRDSANFPYDRYARGSAPLHPTPSDRKEIADSVPLSRRDAPGTDRTRAKCAFHSPPTNTSNPLSSAPPQKNEFASPTMSSAAREGQIRNRLLQRKGCDVIPG